MLILLLYRGFLKLILKCGKSAECGGPAHIKNARPVRGALDLYYVPIQSHFK